MTVDALGYTLVSLTNVPEAFVLATGLSVSTKCQMMLIEKPNCLHYSLLGVEQRLPSNRFVYVCCQTPAKTPGKCLVPYLSFTQFLLPSYQ